MDISQSISLENIQEFRSSYRQNTISRLATRAVSKTGIDNVCYDTEHAKKMNHKFSVDVPTMSAANQKNSGRCWIFSGLNLLREKIARDLHLGEFELSQNFSAFYDHLEKANTFLEHIIRTADRPTDDRCLAMRLSSPVGDGGWWEYFAGICGKYGVVPKDAMPETYQSSNSGEMNMLLNMQLREDAMTLRKAIAAGKTMDEVRSMKNEMLKRAYNILAICLGDPPETFDFEYVDKDGAYHADRGLTPKAFYEKYIGRDLENVVTLLNAPTADKPFNKVYTVAYEESLCGEHNTRWLNVTMEEMKAAIIRQLQDNDLVWFVCDSDPCLNREEGIWDRGMYDYVTPFGLELKMDKGERLMYRENDADHAMLLTGVNLVDGKPDKWKVQNSWGTDKADKGYFIMSDEWFEEYVYLAAVDRKYLTGEQKALLDQEPVVLPPWDVLA